VFVCPSDLTEADVQAKSQSQDSTPSAPARQRRINSRVLAAATTGIDRHTPFEALPNHLTINEVAAYYGTTPGSIYTAVAKGAIQGMRFGREWRIPKSGVSRG
jgi:excisionase family DNA binding protein